MAISQSVSRFFLPNLRRSRPKAGGGGGRPIDPAMIRALAGVDEILEGMDAPAQVAEYIREDLKDAFKIKIDPKSPYFRPGYEPGRIPQAEVNLIDLVTDPIGTTWKTVTKPFEGNLSKSVDVPAIFTEQLNDAVWEHLYDSNAWKGADGKSVVPDSTRAAVKIWNQRTGLEITRKIATKAVKENPGMTVMKAGALERHYRQVGDGTNADKFKAIRDKAEPFDNKISTAFSEGSRLKGEGDEFAKAGRIAGRGEAKHLWEGADAKFKESDNFQIGWVDECKKLGDDNPIDVTDKEFKLLTGGAGPLYNSPEASYTRFFEARNLHFATLNLLKTYKKDGVWGVVKYYGWKQLTNKFKDYYPPALLGKGLNSVAEKLGAERLLARLTGLQTFTKRFMSARNVVQNFLKGVTKKVAVWVVRQAEGLLVKLGLGSSIGAILGTGIPIPVVGNAIGAVIGAVVQFAVEELWKKVGAPVAKIVAYVIFAIIGSFTLFAIGITTLIAIVLSNNPYPWEQGGSAAAAQRFVEIEITACDAAAGCSYQNPLRVSNGQHSIGWRVTIRNISSGILSGSEFSFSQSQCAGAGVSGFDLAPGATRVVTCSGTFTETDEVVSNTVSFASADPVAGEESVGIVIFGNPPVTIPTGWPVASGCLTQGPNGSYSHSNTEAIDIGSISTGTAVRATFNGIVQSACWESGDGCDPDGYGNYVRVSALDGSFSAIFAHLASTKVDDGDRVTIGQQLGTVDNTGNSSGTHLHYGFSHLPMAEPYIPRDSGSNGSIRGCSENCGLCF